MDTTCNQAKKPIQQQMLKFSSFFQAGTAGTATR
ncbi:hypothetical protein HDC32_001854 [Pseudomonas sp. JAI120]|nr:hypothetical protein [Pseudomonas sp. SJZ073]MBB6312185.1 hypothetical protein [Pseudomonas sp. JAI120]